MKNILFPLLENEVKLQREKKFEWRISDKVEIAPKRNPFLQWLYSTGIVEASSFSAHCADKIFFAQLLENYAPQAMNFHPKTMGLSWFADNSEWKENITKNFPLGFVVKQAGGIDSSGRGVYLIPEDFFGAFAADPNFFLSTEPVPAFSSGIISSGEKFLVQEKINGEMELRLHSLEHRIVRGATYTRWNENWNLELFQRAEQALQDFLDSIPSFLTRGQAWSMDVMVKKEEFRIIEVNTNRGHKKQWSGDMVVPETLGAYVRHLEKFYPVEFVGPSADLFRLNQANREKFLDKVGEEEFLLHEALKRQIADSART